jgi:hypothetical protein
MIQIVDLHLACSMMESLGPIHIDMAVDTMERMQALSGLFRAYDELGPGQMRSVFGSHLSIVVGNRQDVVGIDDLILKALKELFPVEDDLMSDFAEAGGSEMFDDLGSVAIIPSYLGLHISWDDLDNFFSGEDNFREVMSLPMFCGAVFNEFDREHWEFCAAHFGWRVTWPEKILEGKMVDWRKFEKLVKSSGIPISMNTFNIIFEDTGLAFFDENPYAEYSVQDPWPFSYNSITALARQWQKAEPMLDELDRDLQLVVEQPDILTQVLNLIRVSLAPDRQRK